MKLYKNLNIENLSTYSYVCLKRVFILQTIQGTADTDLISRTHVNNRIGIFTRKKIVITLKWIRRLLADAWFIQLLAAPDR